MMKLPVLITMTGFSFFAGAMTTPDSTWVGESELYLNGQLHCSADPKKSPTYRPVGNGYHGFRIHEGGLGWIWPSFTGGCENGHLSNGLQLQQRGRELYDSRGTKVGSLTENGFLTGRYVNHNGDVTIEKLSFIQLSANKARAEVTFKSRYYKGEFTYIGSYSRFESKMED